jgi:hypothetical protein
MGKKKSARQPPVARERHPTPHSPIRETLSMAPLWIPSRRIRNPPPPPHTYAPWRLSLLSDPVVAVVSPRLRLRSEPTAVATLRWTAAGRP